MFGLGLRDGRVLEAKVDGSATLTRRYQNTARLGRPETRQGHLETGSVLPQCQGGEFSVRHRPQRSHSNSSGRRNSLHLEAS